MITMTMWVAPLAVIAILTIISMMMLRRVVSSNEVHIVQSGKETTSYGKDTPDGNVYYEWPSWIPIIGVTKVILPVSVFDVKLADYEAYDEGRVPFVVDVIAFFRITDTNLAAQRIGSFNELLQQLHSIVQGSIRTVLAAHEINSIMVERSKFGQQFTKEVEEQLKSWGVIPVKAIELMDIRDVPNGKVIHNIMEKRKSHIEMDSRVTVASNLKAAQIAEVSALQDVDMQKQLSEETVKVRETAKNKAIGVAKEQAQQDIIVQSAITKNKEMEVIKVQNERSAEIEKQVSIINAEKAKQTSIIMADGNKQTAIINAESNKQSSIIVAEGSLTSKELEAKAITVTGLAQADAERAIQLVPVTTQITLANEIGTNVGYQQYLVSIRQIEANEIVGIEQAKALSNANVKVISNTGTPTEGITKVMDLFSTNGGQKMGAMLESFVNTDVGQQVMSKVLDVTQPKTKK